MDLDKIAINKTINFLSEIGYKYRKIDFERSQTTYEKGEFLEATKVKTLRGIKLYIYFNDSRGKKLKKDKEKLYNYFNCNVFENYATFEYSYKELETEALKDTKDDDEIKKVIQKIQKLLALSKSDNEHEAIVASLMAQKMLAKHDIDIQMVDGTDGDNNGEIKSEKIPTTVGKGNKWKYSLANIIADNYRCKCYSENNDTIYFYGAKQDIVIARRVYAYLFNVCKRLGKAYEKEIREQKGTAGGIYNSYCMGFIKGVNAELTKQCKALMIIIPKSVEKSFEEYSKDFKHTNTKININDGLAYEKGKIEGKRALNAQYLDDNSKYIEKSSR